MRHALAAALLALAVPAAAQHATEDARRPPLFVLEDADSKVYLLGSIHALPADALPLPAAVEAAFEAADVVAFEIDLDAAQSEAPAMAQKGLDGVTVADALSPVQLERFDAALERLGVPAPALHAFEPWLAALTVTAFDVQTRGMMAEGGVDRHLFDRAKALDREIVPFETVALQTDVFDGLRVEDQVAFLMATIDGLDAGDDTDAYQLLLDAWAEGDDDGLATMMTEGLDSSPALFDRLLTARNRAWVPQVEALLARDQDALVVVGAGHLVGEASVVTLLREAGYSVVRQ